MPYWGKLDYCFSLCLLWLCKVKRDSSAKTLRDSPRELQKCSRSFRSFIYSRKAPFPPKHQWVVLKSWIWFVTPAHDTSANKWIHWCLFSITGDAGTLSLGSGTFWKITLKRKCLGCHSWLFSPHAQLDWTQPQTDLSIFAECGTLFLLTLEGLMKIPPRWVFYLKLLFSVVPCSHQMFSWWLHS